MSEQMIKINIENIMEEIRENIKRKSYEETDLSFKDIETNYLDNGSVGNFSIQDLNGSLLEANRYCNIQANHVINGQGLKGKITAFIKKVIRKLIQFYIIPIVDEQREFNAATVKSLNQMNEFIKTQQDYSELIDDLDYEYNKNIKKEISIVEKNYDEIKKENIVLIEHIKNLNKKQEDSEKLIQLLSQKLEITMLKCDKLELTIEKRQEN